MTPGSYLTVAASGGTNFNGCLGSNPDGGGCGDFSTGPALGLSSYSGPANALVGVFLDDSVPFGPAPASLDFSTPASRSQASLSPQLRQVFFIGDGLTGAGSGTTQQFIIPAGATRLFLGSTDSAGANFNNTGSFTVAVNDAIPTVPVLSPTMLLALGLLLLTFAAWQFRRRSV